MRGERHQKLDAQIGYLEHDRGQMDYPADHEAGWPVGPEAVEGTCKYLVKERDNVTGTHWNRAKLPSCAGLTAIDLQR